jgi:hypothetical protein
MKWGQVGLQRRTFGLALGLFCLTTSGFVPEAWAQSATERTQTSASYSNAVDEALTIRKVAIAPTLDNAGGIYARAVDSHLASLLKADTRWELVEPQAWPGLEGGVDLADDPKAAQAVLNAAGADGLFAARMVKGPNGWSARLDLILRSDGRVLAQEVVRDVQLIDLAQARKQAEELFQRVMKRIPYQGLILSRQQARVTLNLGSAFGLKQDQTLAVVQIIGENRHPKFGFLISTEKEIIGRVRLTKVDSTLSFGVIEFERERGAIRRGGKISGLEAVTYQPSGQASASERPKEAPGSAFFGESPVEWIPMPKPSFGQVALLAGLGQYAGSISVTGQGSWTASSLIVPRMDLRGELWINPNWMVKAELGQSILSANNPRSGSSPEKLNVSTTHMSFYGSYSHLLQGDFFGPRIFADLGVISYRAYVDDSSPRSLTSWSFYGPTVGLGAHLPVTDDMIWWASAVLHFSFVPRVAETPVNSAASAQATISEFSLSVEHALSQNLRLNGTLRFELFTASLSGEGNRVDALNAPEAATSVSHRHGTFLGGIQYLF